MLNQLNINCPLCNCILFQDTANESFECQTLIDENNSHYELIVQKLIVQKLIFEIQYEILRVDNYDIIRTINGISIYVWTNGNANLMFQTSKIIDIYKFKDAKMLNKFLALS